MTQPQNTNDTPTDTDADPFESSPVDIYWIVANIFSIIHLIEDKFGPSAVEQIVSVAYNLEKNMREESEKEG